MYINYYFIQASLFELVANAWNDISGVFYVLTLQWVSAQGDGIHTSQGDGIHTGGLHDLQILASSLRFGCCHIMVHLVSNTRHYSGTRNHSVGLPVPDDCFFV